MSRYIRGKRWYTRLVPFEGRRALLDDHPLSTLDRALVVCLCHSKFGCWNGDSYRLFARFSSYLDFFPYFKKFATEERSFYEIVFGQFAQKPHFDVDIDTTGASSYSEEPSVIGGKVMEALITGCREVLAERDITLDIARDVCIYDSHGTRKCSFHLVLGTMCHSDHHEARAFYQEVIGRVSVITEGKYLKFIDMGVYSKLQQFRIVGCQKEGSGRVKRFNEVFEYQGQQYEHIYPEPILSNEHKKLVILYQSLLSFTSGCRMLPSFAPPPTPSIYPTQVINDVQVEEVIALFRERMDTSPFSIRGVKENYIILKRERPSHCPICDKVHQHENPMLMVTSNRVYWKCRRAIGSYLLGEIDTPAQIVTEVEVSPVIDDGPVDEDLMLGDVDYSSLIDQGTAVAKFETNEDGKVIEKGVTTSPVTTSPVTTSPVTTSPVTTSPVTTSPIPLLDFQDTTPIEISFTPQLPPMAAKSKVASPIKKVSTSTPVAPIANINHTKMANKSRSRYQNCTNEPWTAGIKKK